MNKNEQWQQWHVLIIPISFAIWQMNSLKSWWSVQMPGSNGVILVDCTGNRRLSREVYPSKISKDLFQRSDSLETANERWCETIFKQLRTVTSYLQPCTFFILLYWIGTCRWWTVCASDLQDFMSQCQLQCCVQEAFSRFAALAPDKYDLQTTVGHVECHRSTEWQRGKKHLLHDQTRNSTDSSAIFKQILRSKTVPIWCAVLQAVIQKQEAYGIRYAKICK